MLGVVSTLGTTSGTFQMRKQRGLFSFSAEKAAANASFPARLVITHRMVLLLQVITSTPCTA